MKTVKMNTILDLLDYYWEICDEDVDAGNRLVCTIDDLLPFQGKWQRDHWHLVTETGTGDGFINATYDVLWDAACEDYDYIIEYLDSNIKWGFDRVWSSSRWTMTTYAYINDEGYPRMRFTVYAPFIGYEYKEDGIMDGEIPSLLQDVKSALKVKMRQIARRLGKEFNDD